MANDEVTQARVDREFWYKVRDLVDPTMILVGYSFQNSACFKDPNTTISGRVAQVLIMQHEANVALRTLLDAAVDAAALAAADVTLADAAAVAGVVADAAVDAVAVAAAAVVAADAVAALVAAAAVAAAAVAAADALVADADAAN